MSQAPSIPYTFDGKPDNHEYEDVDAQDQPEVESENENEIEVENLDDENDPPSATVPELSLLSVSDDEDDDDEDEDEDEDEPGDDDQDEDREKSEDSYDQQILKAQKEVSEGALEVQRLEGLLKAAKKIQKLSVSNLSLLMARSKEENQPNPEAAKPAAVATQLQPGEEDPDAWRSVPITEMKLDSVQGLGKKKLDTLIHNCPTIGAFEDLRAGEGLTSLDGFGPALAERLEEAQQQWLTNYRSSIFSYAATAKQVAQSEAPLPWEVTDPIPVAETKPEEPKPVDPVETSTPIVDLDNL